MSSHRPKLSIEQSRIMEEKFDQAIQEGSTLLLQEVYDNGFIPTYQLLARAITTLTRTENFAMLYILENELKINLEVNILKSITESRKNMFG